jgi:hypothetical protein
MGRIRKAARFTLLIGGYDSISLIRKESSAESIGREPGSQPVTARKPVSAYAGLPSSN